MTKTFSFEDETDRTLSPFDAALMAEGVTGKVAEIARSIYQQESRSGRNTKTSNAGAVGGMQVLPSTFKSVADKGWDINDPIHNARAGIRYVQRMREIAGDDPALIAAGYYGGPGGLEKAKKGIAVADSRNPNAPDTLQYGREVAARIPERASSAREEDKKKAPLNGEKPATFSFEEGQTQPVSKSAPAVEGKKRSLTDELGHQLGLTARATINGVVSLPAMVSDAVTGPINEGLDVVAGKGNGFRFQKASAALDNLMTKAGVAAPENATERVVQDVGSSIAGTGAMVKGGLTLANRAAAPVAKALGKTLAEGPVLQLASAAAGSGASGVVRENGGSEGAQIAAGLAGSLAPGFAPAAVKSTARGALRGGEVGRQRVAKNIELFEDAAGSVPTLGQATEGRFTRGAESLLSKVPGGAGVMVRKGERQLQEMSSAVQRVSDELAPGASAANAGEAISNGIKGFKDGFKSVQQKLYSTLDKHIPEGTQIQVGNTEFALKELNDGIEGAPNISQFFMNSKIKGIDKVLQADLELSATGGALPYQAVKRLRTLVGQEIADNSLVADVPRSKWRALYGALSEDLGIAAKQAGPKAEQAWQWANQFTKQQLGRLDELSTVVSKNTPESVFKNAVAGTAEGDTTIKRVISVLPKPARKEVAAAMLQRMGRAAPGAQDAAGEAFSSETFLNNLSKLSPQARATIFGRTGDPELLDKVKSIGRMAENLRNGSKVFANPSGTAQALTLKDTVYAAIGALLTGNPGAATIAIGAPVAANVAAKINTNPSVVKFAAGKTTLAPGSAASALGAASRAGETEKPAPAPGTFSFEEGQILDGQMPGSNSPQAPDLAGQDIPSGLESIKTDERDKVPSGVGVVGESEIEGINLEDLHPKEEQVLGKGSFIPTQEMASPVPVVSESQQAGTNTGQIAEVAMPNTPASQVPESQIRPDGTLAVQGDSASLVDTLTSMGIPRSSIVTTKSGVLVGRSQVAKVQQAFDRMGDELQKPVEMQLIEPAPTEHPDGAKVETAGIRPGNDRFSYGALHAPERIQALRDSGEEKVANLLERRKLVEDVQSELASMQATNPELPHHGNSIFNSQYKLRRLSGGRPAESSAHAGMMYAIHESAPTIGMSVAAVNALTEKLLTEVPIDEAPGFVERFTKGLIKRGLVKPFEGADNVASTLEQARDAAMHGALASLYPTELGRPKSVEPESDEPRRISTKEERDALAVGTRYLAPNGQIYTRA